jgi:KipI family sensor histidine kinase inhibitor
MPKPPKRKSRAPQLHDTAASECNLSDFSAPKYKLLHLGDTALAVELGDGIDRAVSAQVLALGRRLKQKCLDGVIESVPTLRSLMVCYDPLVLPAAALVAHIDELMQAGLDGSEASGRCWSLPVCYDGAFAPDLEHVAARTGLSPAQVIERHSALTYHVYMLGFLPGQGYMGDLPPELVLPRRETPRLRVPPGSLAIATTMTCIFPLDTPCGWHVIGRSPVALWENAPSPRALLAPGDQVTFRPVSLREYEDTQVHRAAGAIAGAETQMGAAA